MNYLSFKKFLAAAGLSTRRFGDLCGIGKTTVHRLAQPGHGGLTPKYIKDITPTLLRACRDHLTASNAPADAIHLVLSDIFGEEFTPSIITRATLTPEILRFFGLARDPFAAPRNASEVFLTPEMEHIKALLEDAVKFQGFVALLAPVGAGKTVIKNLLMTDPMPQSDALSSPRDVRGAAAASADGVVLSVNAHSVQKSSPPYEGGVAAASADGVVLSVNACSVQKSSTPYEGGVAAASADGVVLSTNARSVQKSSPPYEGGVAAASDDGVVLSVNARSVQKSSPPYEGGVAAASDDGVVLSTNAQGSNGDAAALPIQNQRSKIQNQIILSPKFADPAKISAAGIVAYILESFQLKPRRSLVLAQKQLEEHLAELTTPVALCFDECHRLSDTTLTALKNFYELGTGGFRRYLGLVLFGQPQFETRLTLPRFREIAERLSVRNLAPFSAGDTENFLDHCLTKAVPSGPPNLGPTPANGAFAPTREGAPTLTGPKSQVQSPKSGLQSSPPYEGGVAAASADGVVLSDYPRNSRRGMSRDQKSKVQDQNGPGPGLATLDPGPWTLDSVFSHLGPGTWDLGLIFSPCAIRAIASRAATPLAVANLAAAAMVQAYKKGERQVTARFIPEDRGPRTARIAK